MKDETKPTAAEEIADASAREGDRSADAVTRLPLERYGRNASSYSAGTSWAWQRARLICGRGE